MPALTKKKTKKKTTSKGMRGSEISPGERKKPRVGFKWLPRTKSGIGADAGTSKGGRGTEIYNKGKGRKR